MSSAQPGLASHFFGDAMRIQIESIERLSERRYLARIQLDQDIVVAHISELSDRDILGFNFDEEFFDVLFAFDGLGARFNRDYWGFREEDHAPFPWDYGEHNREILDQALKVTGTQIEMLQ